MFIMKPRYTLVGADRWKRFTSGKWLTTTAINVTIVDIPSPNKYELVSCVKDNVRHLKSGKNYGY